MAKRKLTVEEKREVARHHILEVSLELFFTKGYQETTTRDIITKAGILNGSLYNRFKSKNEILISLVKEAVTKVIDETRQVFENEKNLLLAGVFPGALQIYAASKSVRMASLLYEVHCAWGAVEEYIQINLAWAKEMFSELGIGDVDADLLRFKMVSIVGAVGDLMGYYANGGTVSYRSAVKEHILHLSAVLGIPVMDIDALMEKVSSIIEAEDLVFLGHRLSEKLPEFQRSLDSFSDL